MTSVPDIYRILPEVILALTGVVIMLVVIAVLIIFVVAGGLSSY